MASSSSSQVPPESWQVFINFRGEEVRKSFLSHLKEALTDAGIKPYVDTQENRGEELSVFFTRIKESKIALLIISSKYADSKWCLNELVVIMEQVKEGKLKIIPIFFNVTPEELNNESGNFFFRVYVSSKKDLAQLAKWESALKSVSYRAGLCLSNYGTESNLVREIVRSVKKLLAQPLSGPNVLSTDISPEAPSFQDEMNRRLKKLEGKIDFKSLVTQTVVIVGMPGIGKTTLADMHFNKYKNTEFVYNKNISGIHEKSIREEPDWLKKELLNGQELNDKAALCKSKSFLVLDDVSHKNQIDFLGENLEKLSKGSKIVITTREKSWIPEKLVHDTYVVRELNDTDSWELFEYHAFNDHVCDTTGSFLKLSRKFVDYAGGNPRALEELGKELCRKDKAYWEERIENLPHCCNPEIRTELRSSYDNLTDKQKDAFLDIACFFRSEEEDYVKCLLEESGDDDPVKDLAEKMLICISAGRIEMHNLLCTFGKEIGSSDANISGERMCKHEEFFTTIRSRQETKKVEKRKKGNKKVRGIFLDTYKVKQDGIPIKQNKFMKKFDEKSLRYLKIYDSLTPQNCKVKLPDGLEFPFEEIRYLHWENIQLDQLPSDFSPKCLIDLRLPYSKKIQRVWEDVKEVPWLKWVDLSFSENLTDISALSNAFHLRRLNLEGCTSLEQLPEKMNNMERLVFLNLRGCKKLSSLPEKMSLISLKTLILSGCSKFNEFEPSSTNLEFLHLDDTPIKTLPPSIKNLQKLVLLNLKNCKDLTFLPDCIDKLKALEELVLSGCAKLASFPNIKEKMENLQILLLDGTLIEEVVFQRTPQMHGLAFLQRLCLSRNKEISTLQSSISQLHHLKWIDLKYCENLKSISKLPPNLQCLNAFACTSLETVESPLALLMPTEQVSSSFIFTKCEKLKQVAKNEIICYAHNRSKLLSDALNRHNKGFAFENLVSTCFPGSEVPAWFNHRAAGKVLEPELPPHRRDNGFVGIALCVVISFEGYKIQNNNFVVKCICDLKNVKTSSTFFNFHIEDLSETRDEQRTIKSTHVLIGFTSWLNTKQCQEADLENGCVTSKDSVRFEVTDGTCEAANNCRVLKCGFSLVSEFDNGSWDANASPMVPEPENASSDAYVGASSNIHECDDNGSSEASLTTEEVVTQGENRFLDLLRRSRWLFNFMTAKFRSNYNEGR